MWNGSKYFFHSVKAKLMISIQPTIRIQVPDIRSIWNWICTIAYFTPPQGHSRWTMQAIADELIRLEFVDYITDSTVCNVMKKTKLNRGL